MANGHSNKIAGPEGAHRKFFSANSPKIKFAGIREPSGRVKGYRVEIRPPLAQKKFWLGTFDTRDKAKRAYDVGTFLTGKDPLYFLYPEAYLPKRDELMGLDYRNFVISMAKKYAVKTEVLAVNPSAPDWDAADSLLPHTSKCAPASLDKESTDLAPRVGSQPNTPLLDSAEEVDSSGQWADQLPATVQELQVLIGDDPGAPKILPEILQEHSLTPVECEVAVTATGPSSEPLSDFALFNEYFSMKDLEEFSKSISFEVVDDFLNHAPPQTIFSEVEGDAYIPPLAYGSKRKWDDYNNSSYEASGDEAFTDTLLDYEGMTGERFEDDYNRLY